MSGIDGGAPKINDELVIKSFTKVVGYESGLK